MRKAFLIVGILSLLTGCTCKVTLCVEGEAKDFINKPVK